VTEAAPAQDAAAVLNAPPPAPAVEGGEGGEPAEITAMRKASGAPFPPPGKFPPPPGLKKAMAEAGEAPSPFPKPKAKAGKPGGKSPKKKLIFMAAGGVLLLAVLGGGFVAYQKFTEPPPEPPRKPRPVAKPVEAKPEPTAAAVEAKPVEAAATNPAGVKPAETAAAAEPKVPVETKPVEPPPPPPPSVAFRSWVENLKIGGSRPGATPRVFIGNSSYGKGDLVNPTLGITFEGVSETKMIMFKDKTGARMERRQ
jgi:hypothetical protein